MTSTPEQPGAASAEVPDERLLAAHDLALAALHEITRPETVGDPAGYRVEHDGIVSLLFANRMPGYPGWFWTVSLAVVAGAEPTVLEAELLPGQDALLAPEWVPWAVRLAEYQAQQAAAATAAEESDDETDGAEDGSDDELDDERDDEDLDDLDDDADELDDVDDLDGVDIDELDESDEDDSDDDESDEDESDDEE